MEHGFQKDERNIQNGFSKNKQIMKRIQTYKNFNLLLEFNRKDINLLLSPEIEKTFTISFEIELECDDPKYITHVDDSLKMKEIKDEFITKSKELDLYNEENINYLMTFIDINDLDSTYDLLEKPSIVKNIDEGLLSILFDILDKHETDDSDVELNLDYGIKMIKKHLPNFYKKWHKELNFCFDQTLIRGIEINLKKYLIGLNNGIQMINDFYDDFEKQDYWFQDSTTSVHINLGFINPVNWNITKGLIMLSEIDKDNIPFIYKDMISRMNTVYTRSLLKDIKDKLKEKIKNNKIKTLKEVENEIEKLAGKSIKLLGAKTFSVNIERIKNNNYVEFRHIGGKINRKLLIDKILYLSYIAYLMTTDYKQLDYYKKLYKYAFE